MLADIVYEGARGVLGPFLGSLGASAAQVGLITGVGEATAERLFKEGLKSVMAIAASDVETLSAIPGVGEKSARQWIEAAGKILDQGVA